ncbi:hypothetical protein V8C35DRAFT_325962 [Trichoderma chlorosporum]
MRHFSSFNITWLFLAVPSVASMLEVFHGTSCDDTPTGITQMLYASHAGYSFCGTAQGYGVDLVVRSGEEPDNPDWPWCKWTFYSDPLCREVVGILRPEGHSCACAVLPALKSFKIDCLHDPDGTARRRRRRRHDTSPLASLTNTTHEAQNFSKPSNVTNQSSGPVLWGNSCDRPVPTFRTELSFVSGEIVRNEASMMVDRFEVLEYGDPGFVGNIFHGVHQEIYPIFTQLEKLWKFDRNVTVRGPLKTEIEFNIHSESVYALGTAIEAINPERLPRVLYVLFYTMRRQGLRTVKFRLTSLQEGTETPVLSMIVRVKSSVP